MTPDPPQTQRLAGLGKKLDRAAEYRRLAMAAGALAETSLLTNVREKHLAAAARWIELAVQNEIPVLAPVWPPAASAPSPEALRALGVGVTDG